MSKENRRTGFTRKLKAFITSKDALIVLSIFVFALLVRIIYLNQIADNPFFNHPIVDCATFHEFALKILSGEPPTREAYFQAPFYYYILAFAYKLIGVSLYRMRLLQFILGSFNCVLTYFLGKRLFGRGVGLASALIMSVYGTLIFFEGELLRPVLIITLNLILLHLLYTAISRKSGWLWFGSGILLGISAITKPTVMLFGLVVPVWMAFRYRRREDRVRWKRAIIWVVVFIMGAIIVIAPITIRNYVYSEEFVLISSNYGVNFYIGSHPQYDQMVGIRPGYEWESLFESAFDAGYDTVPGAQTYFVKKAFTKIFENPIGYLKLLLKKVYLFVNGDEIMRNQEIYPFRDYSSLLGILLWKRGIAFPYGLLFPLGIMGLIVAIARKKNIAILVLFLITHLASIILFFVCARYRMPIVPLLAIFSSFGVYALVKQIRDRFWKLAVPALAILVGLLILSNYQTGEMSEEFSADSYYNLGEQLAGEGDVEGAEKLFLKAVELKPDYPEANGYLGMIYDFRGEYEKALKRYQIVLESYPEYTKVILNLGNLYMKMGEVERAIEKYERVLELEPENEPARENLKVARDLLLQREIEETDPSIKSLLEKLSQHRDDPIFLNDLGIAYLNAGLYRPAVEYLSRAINLAPDYPQFHNNLGIAYAELGKYEEARGAFEYALKLDPENVSAMNNLKRLESLQRFK